MNKETEIIKLCKDCENYTYKNCRCLRIISGPILNPVNGEMKYRYDDESFALLERAIGVMRYGS